MHPRPIAPADLDVDDPRLVGVRLGELATALGCANAASSHLADLLLGHPPGHFDANPLSFDQVLSLSLALCLTAAGCSAPEAATAVRLHWPELSRVALELERARTSMVDPEVRLHLVVSGALAPPPLVEAVDLGEGVPPSGMIVAPASTLATLRGLIGDAAWASGIDRLARLFGIGRVALPDEGLARDMPRGGDFLTEGPYWDRLAAVLHADLPNLFGATGPTEARRLRRQVDYLLEPPPIDQWKREVGTTKVLPRVKHLVEAIADAGGLVPRARSHPDTLKAVDPDDAVATLRGHLEALGRAERR